MTLAPVAKVAVTTTALAGAAGIVAANPAPTRQDRGVWEEGVEVALDLIDFVDLSGIEIGDLSAVGDLVGGVAEIGSTLFAGLG